MKDQFFSFSFPLLPTDVMSGAIAAFSDHEDKVSCPRVVGILELEAALVSDGIEALRFFA